MNSLYKKALINNFPDIVEFDVPLSTISHWKIGGKAPAIIRPRNKQELIKVQRWLYQTGIPSIIVGGTTNLLFSDEELQAVVIQIGSKFSTIQIDGTKIIADPGIWTPSLARLAMQASLSGIEHICGIPGTLGGLIVMNGGSQRKGIGDVVDYVRTIDYNGKTNYYNNEECKFSYRYSLFQEKSETIVEVGLRLNNDRSKSDIRYDMLEILRARRKKFPRKQPNCGSVFISNPDMYKRYGSPGEVIESLGLKGMNKNNAQISERHANFIVNNGNAKAWDVLYLIDYVKETVFHKTGYKMMVEAKYINHKGKIINI